MNSMENYLKTNMCEKNTGNNNYLGNINEKIWKNLCISNKIK